MSDPTYYNQRSEEDIWQQYPPFSAPPPPLLPNFTFTDQAPQTVLDANGELNTNYWSDSYGGYPIPAGSQFPPQIDTSVNMGLHTDTFVDPNTTPPGLSESPNGYSPTSPNSMDIPAGSSGSSAPPDMSLEDMHQFTGNMGYEQQQTPSPPMLYANGANGQFHFVRADEPTAGGKCIKCLAQRKSCSGTGLQQCDYCQKQGDIHTGWNTRFQVGDCVDSTIARLYFFDYGCKAELRAIFISAGRNFYRYEHEMISNSPDVFEQLGKTVSLMPLTPRSHKCPRYTIPPHDGSKMFLFRAAKDFLHKTRSYLGPYDAKFEHPHIKDAGCDQIHDLLVIAAERRRAGRDLLNQLQGAVHGVFRGNKKTLEQFAVRAELLQALTCINIYLRKRPFQLPPFFLDTGKSLAYVIERFIRILTGRIKNDKTQTVAPASLLHADDEAINAMIHEINSFT